MDVNEVLESLLRGAAMLSGCTSANLILINVETRVIEVRVGTTASSVPGLDQVEAILGNLRSAVFSLDQGEGSLVLRSWRERAVLETRSFQELLGSAFAPDRVGNAEQVLGEHSFLCVPAIVHGRCYGVVVFEKPGIRPFGHSQRELLIRYARRISEILDNDARERGGALLGLAPGLLVGVYLVHERSVASCWPERNPEGLSDQEILDLAACPGDDPRTIRLPARGPRRSERELVAEVVRLPAADAAQTLVLVREVPAHLDPQSQRLLHLALGETAPALLVDPDMRISSCNDATARLFGIRDLAGRPVADLFETPADARTLLDRTLLVLSDGHQTGDVVLRRADGGRFPGRVEALALANDAGEIAGYLLLIRTGGASSEDADRLLRRERLATMGELAAQLAHEIRNPLLAIGASLSSLQHDLADRPGVLEVLRMAVAEVARLDMALRDYLSLAVRHGGSPTQVNLPEIIRETIRLMQHSPKQSGRTILCEVPEGLSVRGDPEGLRHVFFNLLLNALEATPPGGTVRFGAEVSDAEVAVLLDDSGPGLACDPTECFEPFFTTKPHGTGLGLTVCRKVVEASGGVLTLHNRKEGGCRARVTLPRERVRLSAIATSCTERES